MSGSVGTRAPVHSTAVGKALLAFQPDEVVDGVLARGLPASTPNTLTDARALRRELAAVRSRGYAIDDEESEVGLRSIAAPIRNDAGQVVASISIAGPAHRITKKALLRWARERSGRSAERLAGKFPKPEDVLGRVYRHTPGRRFLPLEPQEIAGEPQRAVKTERCRVTC